MSSAEQGTIEETIAAIRLRTRHHDPYDEWERETRRDALHAARRLLASYHLKQASLLHATRASDENTLCKSYTSQLAEVQRLLESLRMKEREEYERMKNRWKEEDKARFERIERVIKIEEDRVRVRVEAEIRRREEERIRRKKEEQERYDEEERIRKESLRREAEERNQREKEEKEKQARERLNEELEVRKAVGLISAEEDWRFARETLKNLKAGPMRTVKGDKTLKSQWNAIRRQITPRIGQLTQDQDAVSKIISNLISLVHPPAPLPPPLYFAALSSLSKSIILQAETEVTAEKKSAIPLARVTCTLLHHPLLADSFPEIFFAKVVQRTGGWGVPVVVPAQDVDGRALEGNERRLAMGYRRTGGGDGADDGEGEWESAGQYATRITGVVRVYFSVLGMSLSISGSVLASKDQGQAQRQIGRAQKLFQHPRLWTYFARMLADERLLETVMAAQILHAALDVAGFEAQKIWGRQWIKLLELLYEASTTGLGTEAISGVGRPEDGPSGESGDGGSTRRMLGGRTPEGKAARVRVQLEIERIMNSP